MEKGDLFISNSFFLFIHILSTGCWLFELLIRGLCTHAVLRYFFARIYESINFFIIVCVQISFGKWNILPWRFGKERDRQRQMNPNHLVRWEIGSLQDPNMGLVWSALAAGKFPSLLLNQMSAKFMFCASEYSPYNVTLDLVFLRIFHALLILCIIVGFFHLPIIGFWVFEWIIKCLVMLSWIVEKMSSLKGSKMLG